MLNVYSFPVENPTEIEHKYVDLLVRYRDGQISDEECDWMDWANTVLDQNDGR